MRATVWWGVVKSRCVFHGKLRVVKQNQNQLDRLAVTVTLTETLSGRHGMDLSGLVVQRFRGNQVTGITVPFTAVKSLERIAMTIPVFLWRGCSVSSHGIEIVQVRLLSCCLLLSCLQSLFPLHNTACLFLQYTLEHG